MDGATGEQGRLKQLLAQARSSLDVEAVDTLIAGVLAAPPEIGASWHALVDSVEYKLYLTRGDAHVPARKNKAS